MSKPAHVRSVLPFLVLLIAVSSLAAAAQPLAEGAWNKKTASIQGSWSIVEEGGSRFLVLSDDFRTKKAPDLKLFLSPQELSSVNGKNATDRAVLIGALQRVRGGQRYGIPDGVDLDEYPTLLLHCEKYSKLWGAATIR